MKMLCLLSAVTLAAAVTGCASAPEKAEKVSSGTGVLEINTVDYGHSDINVRPNLPVQNSPAVVSVRVRNNGGTLLKDVTLELFEMPSGAKLGTARIDIPAGKSVEKLFDWQVGGNGFRQLRAVAAQGENRARAEFEVPVISRPLYFPWFGGHTPGSSQLRYANIVLSDNQKQFDYWHGRGVLPCFPKGVDYKKNPEQYAAYLQQGLTDPATGASGIMIDEMGGYDNNEILSGDFFKGLKLYLDRNPQFFTALWVCGSLHPAYCNITRNVYRKDKGINLLMLECYSYCHVTEFSSWKRFDYYDQRIFTARQQDVLSNAVMALTIAGDKKHFNFSGYELEDEVRYIRRKAPEMPGVGFFHIETELPELVPVADSLCRKYFIAPVLQVWEGDLQLDPVTPKAGETFRVMAGVHNIGAMDAAGVTVRVYLDDKPVGSEVVDIPALQAGKPPVPARVSVDCRVSEPGSRTLRVEVAPAAGQTLLDACAERKIAVH